MASGQGDSAVAAVLHNNTVALWVIAIIFFGLGDFLTTIVGLQLDHVI